MNRNINVSVGMRVPVDKDMTPDRQLNPLTQGPLLLEAAADNAGARFYDIRRNLHEVLPNSSARACRQSLRCVNYWLAPTALPSKFYLTKAVLHATTFICYSGENRRP